MLFNSLSFLLLFLPTALIGYYTLGLLGHKWAALWLVFASFVFYTWWTASLVFLLAGSIAFNFTTGVLILRAQGNDKLQSIWLTIGIAGDLLLLFYYKYFFAMVNWLGYHGILNLPHPYSFLLPLGISFFTFTQIGYLIDCKGGIVKENHLLEYCLFVTFFPHLIAGPILHHREMMPQFKNPDSYRFKWENFCVGGTLFIIGLAKKDIIADYFITTVNHAFDGKETLAFFPAWDGALSYSLQLYFDFSGYSDMACGLALLFGLRFPANFNSPYRAVTVIDYWQRFHMTLTRYITLYIFSPVALWATRRRRAQGKIISGKALTTPSGFLGLIVLPTFCAMIPAGIWHGAGFTFLVFGLLHGCYLTINHFWRTFGPRASEAQPHPLKSALVTAGKIALTYLAVVIAQVVFRSATVHDATRYYASMVGVHGIFGSPLPGPTWSADAIFGLLHLLAMIALYVIIWTMPNSLQILGKFKPTLSDIRQDSLISFEYKPSVAWGIAIGALAALALLEVTGMTEFLYFRF